MEHILPSAGAEGDWVLEDAPRGVCGQPGAQHALSPHSALDPYQVLVALHLDQHLIWLIILILAILLGAWWYLIAIF